MRLQFVGSGINELRHLSLEGLEQLKKADRVLILPIVAKSVETLLNKYGVKNVKNLRSFYRNGENDEDTYRSLFKIILSECYAYKHVVVLVPGHPRIGVTLVQWFEAEKEKLGIEVEVIPGISSFAMMINDLKKDPLERGSVLIDANRLLLFDFEIEPSMDHYIYHVCSIGTAQISTDDAARNNRIDLLKRKLLRHHPESKDVVLISSPVDGNSVAEMRFEKIGNLENFLPFIHYGTTLFIPGSTPKKIDREYLKCVTKGIDTNDQKNFQIVD